MKSFPESEIPESVLLLFARRMLESLQYLVPQRVRGLFPEEWSAQVTQRASSDTAWQHLLKRVSLVVDGVERQNTKNWKQASAHWGHGQEIYRALLNKRQELKPVLDRMALDAASRIRTLPQEAAMHAVLMARRWQLEGKRPEALREIWQKEFKHHLRVRAQLVARTEVMKASSEINEARARSLGYRWYLWRTAKDVRVRESHKVLDGVLVCFDDPPQPEALIHRRSTLGKGHAGMFPNCRCTQIILLEPEQVRWPHKVYLQGRIQTMTRAEWERRSGWLTSKFGRATRGKLGKNR